MIWLYLGLFIFIAIIALAFNHVDDHKKGDY